MKEVGYATTCAICLLPAVLAGRAQAGRGAGAVAPPLGLFAPPLREMIEMAYEFAAPYLLDGAKLTRAFGFAPTPHRDALAETIAWYRGSRQRN